MDKEIITVSNVRVYLDKEGTAWLNAEDVARGLGFVEVKDGKEYVRWRTINAYLVEFGFSQEVAKADFIPENMFYRLAMKAKNETAEKFQAKVADEILPSIRKYGMYATDITIEKMIANPDFAIQLLQKLKDERAAKQKFQEVVARQAVQIAEMTPKVRYCELILQSKEALPITVIAKDYGYSGQSLNKLLSDMGIQYRLGSGTWLVYQKYAESGYTCTKTFAFDKGGSKTLTYWTQLGRLFLYEELKKKGIIPLIEQAN